MYVSAEGLTRQKRVCHDTLPWVISFSLGRPMAIGTLT
jgi:hypothetical protein